MERKRQLYGRFLTCLLVMAVGGCTIDKEIISEESETVSISLRCPEYMTRVALSEDSMIHDINLLVFHNGRLEYQKWGTTTQGEEEIRMDLPLVLGRKYTFYALANYGRNFFIPDLEALENHSLQIDSPYITNRGCLMNAIADVEISDGCNIELELCRMMAKVSICINRGMLSEGIGMEVRRISIGNCPRYIRATGENHMENRFDRFDDGFRLSGDECRNLNMRGQGGKSGEVSLYLLENLQGDFPYAIEEDEEKVLDDDDPLSEICSYVEIEMEYRSSKHFSTDRNLIYRFYLGEGVKDLNVERNCHYHITVTPEDDGLSGNGWRVDKTGLGTYIREIILSEQNISMNYKGQDKMLGAEIIPQEASNRHVTWRSSNSDIASVSDDGRVHAVNEGSCSIICSAADGSGCSTECNVEVKYDPPFFMMYPGTYVSGKVGESIHIWCEFFPPNAAFDPGYEELNYDRSRGIYDYTIDEDGHGVTLSLKKPGTGIVYMTSGDPINESGMTLIEVKP